MLATVEKHDIPLAEATTPSLEALKAYSTAWQVWSSTGPGAAVPHLDRAIGIDPQFAMAHALLGRMYSELWEPVLAAESAGKAYALRNRVSDPERFFIMVPHDLDVTGNLETARQTAELWAETYPRDVRPRGYLSWIYQELGNTPINLLGRLQSKINSEFPGMKISMTEYESGGWNHIAGTIAQADNLGIFGAQGVFAANFWPPNGTYSYALAGFRVFRDFDGAGANFGDTSLQSASSNVANVVVYASSDTTAPGRIVFVAINRSTSSQVTAITGQSLTGTAQLYQITAASAQNQTQVAPVSIGTMPVIGSTLTLTLPALSVTTIEVN